MSHRGGKDSDEPLRLSPTAAARRPLLVLVGPTAVGKSAIGLRLAEILGTEVLTADSRQVYRGMDIATDKPTAAQRQVVPHRLLDLVDPAQTFNAGAYRRAALVEIERLYGDGRLPLVVGGTGLYVRALIQGICEAPRADQDYRAFLVEQVRLRGGRFLHETLQQVDPVTAERLHPHDEVKIMRALEVHHLSGQRLSDMQREQRAGEPAFTPLLIGLTRDRDRLYRRIDARVDAMFEQGVVAETAELLARGYGRDLPAMKGLGYRQIAGYLAGEYDEAEARRLLKRDTRHFAKRQLTWFRKEPGLVWWPLTDEETTDAVAARVAAQARRFVQALTEGAMPALDRPSSH